MFKADVKPYRRISEGLGSLFGNDSMDWMYSAASVEEGDDNEKEALYNEKSAITSTLMGYQKIIKPPEAGVWRKKNSKDSIRYRKYGNDFYNTKMPDERTHEKVWRFYTQSIALAPNDSSELALGYGNRSALLFHLQKYEDSIKDCDRAIEITTCEFLKCKLMCRKAECLALLNKTSAESVSNEALKKLSGLTIKEDLKRQFIEKIDRVLNVLKTQNSTLQTTEGNKLEDRSELVELKYQKEAPCASNSIKINYSKQWGRHITATKDIKPGDIVAIPDNFCTLLSHEGMYLFCSNCVQPAWSSIPCKDCIFDIYCSEKCMSEAWNKYHKYECPIYPYILDIDQPLKDGQRAIRLLLIMIHRAGGIEQLKKVVDDAEQCKDLRTRGFSSNGIFLSDCSGSMYSHMCGSDVLIQFSRINQATVNLLALTTHTDLFGKKIKTMITSKPLIDDIVFVGAVLIKIDSILQKYSFELSHEFGEEKVQYAITFNAFSSLFNHSCNPNTELLPVEGNKTVIYAKHPIKKGEQLFVSYCGMRYLSATKKQRQEKLKKIFGFTCRCVPYSENWSNMSVPDVLKNNDVTLGSIPEIRKILDPTIKSLEDLQYSSESVKKIQSILEILSSKMSVQHADYSKCDIALLKMFIKYFGNWTFDMSHKCIDA